MGKQSDAIERLQEVFDKLTPDMENDRWWSDMLTDGGYVLDPITAVVYNNKAVAHINENLLSKQKCWDNLPDIKRLHRLKAYVYDRMFRADKP